LRSNHRDWMAVVRLGMRHLAGELEAGQPLFIVGYSTGAALAVEYAAARLLGEDLPPARGLILLSPAIGVSPLAAFAVWQSRLAALPGLHTLMAGYSNINPRAGGKSSPSKRAAAYSTASAAPVE
ncbi:MAG: alpha/beta hydrolase, partial [Gammaproteobacteria bacterium]|nr:alpha/beta hydrolase [Gammaproteobacteria bacterium]